MKSKLIQLSKLSEFKNGKFLPMKERSRIGRYDVYGSNGSIAKTEKCLYDDPVIAIGRVGANCGTVFSARKPSWITDNCIVSIPKSETDFNFLFYVLKFLELNRLAIGSAQPMLTQDILNSIEIISMTNLQQHKIGKILYDLDIKIQNLQNQSKILEQIAQIIFKSWFIDFDGVSDFDDSELGKIPNGWKVDNLFNCANYVNGSAFRDQDSSLFGIGKPIIKITELKYGINSKTLFTEKNMDSKYDIYDGDILFAWSGSPDTSIDTFIWTEGNAILNQHIHKINLKHSKDKSFIYFLFKYLNKTFIEIARDKQTTGLGHVTIGDMKKLLVVLPSDKFMLVCVKHFNPIFDILYNNKIEISKLTKTRDILLPKLMSGEIRV